MCPALAEEAAHTPSLRRSLCRSGTARIAMTLTNACAPVDALDPLQCPCIKGTSAPNVVHYIRDFLSTLPRCKAAGEKLQKESTWLHAKGGAIGVLSIPVTGIQVQIVTELLRRPLLLQGDGQIMIPSQEGYHGLSINGQIW